MNVNPEVLFTEQAVRHAHEGLVAPLGSMFLGFHWLAPYLITSLRSSFTP